jgi:hypothetical protein
MIQSSERWKTSGSESKPERPHGNIHMAVCSFVGDDEQFDSLTMLCMEYRKEEG